MPKQIQLLFNHDAPNLTLLDASGKEVELSSLWKTKPLLLSFTRHFGCTQCKAMLNEIVAGKDRIHGSGLGIAIIMQAQPQSVADFSRQFAPGLLCLADPDRKAYRAYGLERGNLFQTFLNPTVWKAISKAKKQGYNVEPPPAGQDAMQMSGVFIIGMNGKILLPYYYDNIADHPAIDLLLSGVLNTKWDQPFDGPVGPGIH